MASHDDAILHRFLREYADTHDVSDDIVEYSPEIVPNPSGAIISVVVGELVKTGNTTIISRFSEIIAIAVKQLRNRAENGVNIPCTAFDLGLLELLLGKVPECLNHYALGVAESSDESMIKDALSTVSRLPLTGVSRSGLGYVEQLLRLGLLARFPVTSGAWAPLTSNPPPISAPILVLVGGCDGLATEATADLSRLANQLTGFRGTIISGGTSSGVAGLAGQLQAACNDDSVATIGYLPRALRHKRDRRYRYEVLTDSNEYSVEEPFAYWRDLLASGFVPSQVRVVGYDGNRISAFEIRLAVAMGARLGIVVGSGRAADEFLQDSLWRRFRDTRPPNPSPIQTLNLGTDEVATFVSSSI